ncbi:MAG TPA: GNAT family protein [Halococcus sp.]|nr:GNAT family protein [Halococcus sp.]
MPGARIESGERVTLRTIEREDAEFIQRAHTDPRIRYPLGTVTHKNRNQIEDHIEEFIEDDSHVHFLVCLDSDSEARSASDHASGRSPRADAGPGHPDDETTPIGVVNMTHVDWDRPYLVYWLVPEHHGEGYGKEAVSLVIESVFRTFDIHGIGAAAFDYNAASRGLLESLGFTEEGREREARFIDGKYRDVYQYGLLRREWETTR